MKFVHIADMHFDMPFTTLTSRADLGDIRRLEQRQIFKKIIDYIKQNEISHFFIAGDFYDHNYIKKSTIDFINNLFKTIPQTKIYISPGNHDPYINNSFYNNYKWSENVHIFYSKVQCIEEENVDIYGCGFDDFYFSSSEIENIKVKNKEKVNILITHGTLNGSTTSERDYNPLAKRKLEKTGFDYIALGHIHKLDYNTEENQNIVYPGSTISLGFDELGKHGMIVGNITKEKLELKFVPLDEKEFKIIEIDITELEEIEELLEKINEIQYNKNIFYKIEIIGRRKFEININTISKIINNKNIIKLKDFTKIDYDIKKISNENTLKGLFAKEILEQIEKGEISQNLLEDAFEIGYEILAK